MKSRLLYGAKTWRMTERYKKRLDAIGMNSIRRTSRISKRDRIRNEKLKELMDLKAQFWQINKKQLTWYRHLQ